MRKLFVLGAVLAAVAFPTASHAQDTSKWLLGLRLGYGAAMGDAMQGQPMKDAMPSQIPVQLDALYKFTPEWAAGVYLSYGFGQLSSAEADACDAMGVECSMSSVRFGIEGTYSFTQASATFVPWVGAGIGYESVSETVAVGGVTASQDSGGWEFLNLQVGGDWKVSPAFAIGPYIMYSIGQYSNVGGNDITNTATHEWFNLGIRGKFDL